MKHLSAATKRHRDNTPNVDKFTGDVSGQQDTAKNKQKNKKPKKK
jgi:hypothetical protein